MFDGGFNPPLGAWQIPNTPASDNASVMYSHGGGLLWNGFDTGDIMAAQWLFPDAPQVSLSYPTNLTWQAIPNALYYDIYYSRQELVEDQAGDFTWQNVTDYLGRTTSTSFFHGMGYTGDTSCSPQYDVYATFSTGSTVGSATPAVCQP